MGFISSVLGFFGFGTGIILGLVIGYFFFIYSQSTAVKNPQIIPISEQDSAGLDRMFPEIPLWVKSPDFDRMDWLNKFLECMWPYLDKAVCKTTKEVTKPIIEENTAKFKIDSVEFESLTLGSLPPTFQGMKVYTTEEKEIIMELALKWAANPDITVAVKAFGLKATVQVIDLQVFAIPRITLRPLVPTFPCFASIFVSLMEKPHVDFGLKLWGADVMSIPGLYGYVQETIKTQVAAMYLWPRTLQVPIMDPTKAQKKPVGILHVNVVRANKLKKKDFMGKSDPYVKLSLTDDNLPSKKTSIKRSNLNPEWNEDFKFVIKDPESQVMEVGVYDWEQVGKHDELGMNAIALKDLVPDETKTLTLDLLKTMDPSDGQNDKSRGQIVVDVTYKPFTEGTTPNDISDDASVIQTAPQGTPDGGGLLVVIIHEAQDLEGKHHTNPYVRVTFRGDGKKTKHMKKNRDPRWDEQFQFMCEVPPIDEKVHVEVLSKAPSIGIHSKVFVDGAGTLADGGRSWDEVERRWRSGKSRWRTGHRGRGRAAAGERGVDVEVGRAPAGFWRQLARSGDATGFRLQRGKRRRKKGGEIECKKHSISPPVGVKLLTIIEYFVGINRVKIYSIIYSVNTRIILDFYSVITRFFTQF